MRTTLSPTIVKAALAVGVLGLLALVILLFMLRGGGSSGEPALVADAMAGQAVEVVEGDGDATVWVAGGSSDPRPDGRPDPDMCTAVGGGDPQLVDPKTDEPTTLGGTTLYPVAGIERYSVPLRVTCSGGAVEHVYVTR